jgi:two-component system phosphate regulon sensor histidine kinase PhoR
MRRIQKKMTMVIILVTASLMGMLWVQIILLRKAYDLNRQAFRQNVNAALNSVVEKLENRETVSRVFDVMVNTSPQNRGWVVHQQVRTGADGLRLPDSIWVSHAPFDSFPKVDFKAGKIFFLLKSPQRVRLRLLDTLGQEVKEVVNEVKPAGRHEIDLDSMQSPRSGLVYNLNFGKDSTGNHIMFVAARTGEVVPQSFPKEKRIKIISQVLDELVMLKRPPVQARIQPAVLDSVVQTTIHGSGIDMPYAYGIDTHDDTVRFATPAQYEHKLQSSPLRARLFPNDPFPIRNDLVLYFPQQDFYLLKKSGGLLLSVLVLMSVIVFCFVYTLRTVFKQKHFAESLTQFINNMTHEFKTPISTIGLAGEALKNPAILQDKNKIHRYGDIIHDETRRMRNQVEKILQMAVLEEGDCELNISQIDVHEILSEAVQNFALQVEKRKGEISCQFNATTPVIEADALHFANVIHNLLDNANKYTPEAPRIVVGTESDNTGVHIRIQDNGIGLRAEEQKHVFDKYYRVPTGNVHDVKGFGLGLSYVKLMVEAHGGGVSVESEYQKGSLFNIFMPFTCLNGGKKDLNQK